MDSDRSRSLFFFCNRCIIIWRFCAFISLWCPGLIYLVLPLMLKTIPFFGLIPFSFCLLAHPCCLYFLPAIGDLLFSRSFAPLNRGSWFGTQTVESLLAIFVAHVSALHFILFGAALDHILFCLVQCLPVIFSVHEKWKKCSERENSEAIDLVHIQSMPFWFSSVLHQLGKERIS